MLRLPYCLMRTVCLHFHFATRLLMRLAGRCCHPSDHPRALEFSLAAKRSSCRDLHSYTVCRPEGNEGCRTGRRHLLRSVLRVWRYFMASFS